MTPLTTSFRLKPQGPFSLDAVRDLQCGFLRGTRTCSTDAAEVKLAFPRDGCFDVVGVALRQSASAVGGAVVGTREGAAVRTQVARVLGLDRDARPFVRVLEADAALRALWRQRPGFRPVVSYSPYVMAGWAVLSQRLRMTQAAAIQVRVSRATGDTVEVGGERLHSFPRPQSVLSLSGFPGVAQEKWARLQAVARAALDGDLEVEPLMAVPYEEARERLLSIHGVGPWTADGILMRGCGPADLLPLSERTLHGAVALTYGLKGVPTDEEVLEIAEGWRPFRTWVSVLLISQHFDAARRLTRAA